MIKSNSFSIRLMIFMMISVLLFSFNSTVFSSIVYVNIDYLVAKEKYKWINEDVFEKIEHYAKQRNLQPLFVCALIQRESNGKKYALSKSYARGRMQVMAIHLPKKIRHMTDLLYDDNVNFNLGCMYLELCANKAKGNINETCRMYNQGSNGNKAKYKNWHYVQDIKKDFYDSLHLKNTKYSIVTNNINSIRYNS
jgi:soluble lytic murein transglycosylase-like protein